MSTSPLEFTHTATWSLPPHTTGGDIKAYEAVWVALGPCRRRILDRTYYYAIGKARQPAPENSRDRRKRLLDRLATESRFRWIQPHSRQQESFTFHRIRALLALTGFNLSYISQLTGIRREMVSHFLACKFQGNQVPLERKLDIFVDAFLDGKFDANLALCKKILPTSLSDSRDKSLLATNPRDSDIPGASSNGAYQSESEKLRMQIDAVGVEQVDDGKSLSSASEASVRISEEDDPARAVMSTVNTSMGASPNLSPIPTTLAARESGLAVNATTNVSRDNHNQIIVEMGRESLNDERSRPDGIVQSQLLSRAKVAQALITSPLRASTNSFHSTNRESTLQNSATVSETPMFARGVNTSTVEILDSEARKLQKQTLDVRVEQLRKQWSHPSVGQKETVTFHRVRALLELTGLRQIFICRLTNISPSSLSQYLRCNFKGRQDFLENKLETFINDYLDGKYEGNMQRVRKTSSASQSQSYGLASETAPNSHPPSSQLRRSASRNDRAIAENEAKRPRRTSALTATPIADSGSSVQHGIHESDCATGESEGKIRRRRLLDEQVEVLRSNCQLHFSAGGQKDTLTFHRVRAILTLTRLTQIFVCRLTGANQSSVSQYLRCKFKGRQDLLENKLNIFINAYLDGKLENRPHHLGRLEIQPHSSELNVASPPLLSQPVPPMLPLPPPTPIPAPPSSIDQSPQFYHPNPMVNNVATATTVHQDASIERQVEAEAELHAQRFATDAFAGWVTF